MGNTALYAINEFPSFSLFLLVELAFSFDERRSRPGCGRDGMPRDATGRNGREWNGNGQGRRPPSEYIRSFRPARRSSRFGRGRGRGHSVVVVSCRVQ